MCLYVYYLFLLLAVAFSGCATTQTKTQNEQIESRVTELEKNLQAKDAEIVDLQYQVKDLSSKVEASKPADADQGSQSSTDQGDLLTPLRQTITSRLSRG